MEDDATGHRYGNFPNYYSFHPPKNRLDVLRRSGILSCVIDGLKKTSLCALSYESASSAHDVDTDDREAACGISREKRPRLDNSETDRSPEQALEKSAVEIIDKSRIISYCDLGCNEGNLTWAMAELLSSVQDSPVDNKVNPSSPSSRFTVQCLGLDIDAKLIERANSKYCLAKTSEKAIDNGGPGNIQHDDDIMATFKTANLCDAMEHNNAVVSFINSAAQSNMNIGNSNDSTTSPGQISNPDVQRPRQVFDITTIFSTTMWIHVHAGDKGLKAFLERACDWTKKFILVEPQHSGCYRKANIRLRKMGLNELDVTSSRLKLRPEIEEEIDKIIVAAGFRRVNLQSEKAGLDTSDERDATTSWKRTLHLYERTNLN